MNPDWKPQIVAVIQFIFFFYVSTWCFGLYFLNIQPLFDVWGILFFVCYAIVLVMDIALVIRHLSLPAIMFASPMLPLIALISVLTMLPQWQWLKL